ncbi:hypothetical protein M6B38_181455 [Iris pallida]|uniref:HMA domain-containing protein n=1 Tax=Iris pallida TaxID=29817 RepID=A0AAX6ELS9_IRIPA|nr:hypothetical protein M6B38_181455 [Iris pallida]
MMDDSTSRWVEAIYEISGRLTFTVKVIIHCNGCKLEVKKLVKKIEGLKAILGCYKLSSFKIGICLNVVSFMLETDLDSWFVLQIVFFFTTLDM